MERSCKYSIKKFLLLPKLHLHVKTILNRTKERSKKIFNDALFARQIYLKRFMKVLLMNLLLKYR